MTRPKLNPCPFCGDAVLPVLTRGTGGGEPTRHWVACLQCDAQGPVRDTAKAAAAAWNARARRGLDVVTCGECVHVRGRDVLGCSNTDCPMGGQGTEADFACNRGRRQVNHG